MMRLAAPALLLSVVACSKSDPPAPKPPALVESAPSSAASAPSAKPLAAAEPLRARNVLFLTIDRLRAEMQWNG